MFEELPSDDVFGNEGILFAPEFNFAGLPAGADDRFFRDATGTPLGQLGHQLDLHDATQLGLVDGWLGIDIGMQFDRPTSVWTYPVETVSQSEGGFELVHQSVVVLPHWQLVPDVNGCWSVTIRLVIDTQVAESRMGELATPAAAI